MKSFFFFFFFLGLHLQHTEVPRPGIESELQLRPTPQPWQQQHRIWAVSETYAKACHNDRSITHWASPGIEPASSQTMSGPYPAEPQQELPKVNSDSKQFFFSIFFKFYWSIVDLQGCDNFCYTILIQSYMYTFPSPFRFFSHTDYHTILGSVLCAIQQVPNGQSFHIPQCAYVNPKPPVHPSHSLYLSPLVTTSFSKSVSLFLFCK